MSSSRTSLVRLSDSDARDRPREPVRASGGGFGSLTPDRARVLMFVAARASAVTLLVIVVLVFGTLFAAGSAMTGASGAIAASWLAVHQVPLVIGKTAIGLWPLVPTGFILWLVARDCARAAEPDCTRTDLGWIAGAAVGGPLLITAVCLAVADDASGVTPLQAPDTLSAFAWVIALHLAAAVAGIGSRHWREFTYLLPMPLPRWVIPGAQAGVRAIGRLLAAAGVLTVVSFLAHWSRIGDTFHASGNFVGVIGLILLSLAYLPNVLIDAISVLAGGQVHIGSGSLSLFAIDGAPVPAVPLVAAVPSGPVAIWWLALLIVPAAVGVLTGLDCARASDDRPTAPWATLTASGVAAVLLAALGVMAGGDLGTFGWIGPDVLLTTAAAFVWLAVAGYIGMLGGRWFLLPAAGGALGLLGRKSTRAVPAEDAYDDTDDAYDDYDDSYDDEYEYADDEYADDDYEDDDYDDDDAAPAADYDDRDDYDDDYDAAKRSGTIELDGELLDDDDEPVATASGYDPDQDSDILDAEVVEGADRDN
ncbi:DUF6350 family protein [Nocardia yamanashiensis]|uniref:cell division protein PerM n=1 Tax=Nocardia yamanashiensis TaxID=209247 RepID=UPI001E3DB420|nr:DUF6350 family protein [Nocardia yamanashiensis]UGT39021.1 DUF6350 family protein [Nocardia yamanashiensis]